MNNVFFASKNSVLLLIDRQVGTMKLIQNIPLEIVKRNTLTFLSLKAIANILYSDDFPTIRLVL